MTHSPDNINNTHIQHTNNAVSHHQKKFTTEQAFEKAGSGFAEFKKIFTPAQYKEFINNMTHSVMSQIKQQQEDAMKALQKLKQSETGED